MWTLDSFFSNTNLLHKTNDKRFYQNYPIKILVINLIWFEATPYDLYYRIVYVKKSQIHNFPKQKKNLMKRTNNLRNKNSCSRVFLIKNTDIKKKRIIN